MNGSQQEPAVAEAPSSPSLIRICLSDADPETRGSYCSGLAPCEPCKLALATYVLPKAIGAVGAMLRERLQGFGLRDFLSARRSKEEILAFLEEFESYVDGVPGEPETRAWLESIRAAREDLAMKVKGVLPEPEPAAATEPEPAAGKPKRLARPRKSARKAADVKADAKGGANGTNGDLNKMTNGDLNGTNGTVEEGEPDASWQRSDDARE